MNALHESISDENQNFILFLKKLNEDLKFDQLWSNFDLKEIDGPIAQLIWQYTRFNPKYQEAFKKHKALVEEDPDCLIGYVRDVEYPALLGDSQFAELTMGKSPSPWCLLYFQDFEIFELERENYFMRNQPLVVENFRKESLEHEIVAWEYIEECHQDEMKSRLDSQSKRKKTLELGIVFNVGTPIETTKKIFLDKLEALYAENEFETNPFSIEPPSLHPNSVRALLSSFVIFYLSQICRKKQKRDLKMLRQHYHYIFQSEPEWISQNNRLNERISFFKKFSEISPFCFFKPPKK